MLTTWVSKQSSTTSRPTLYGSILRENWVKKGARGGSWRYHEFLQPQVIAVATLPRSRINISDDIPDSRFSPSSPNSPSLWPPIGSVAQYVTIVLTRMHTMLRDVGSIGLELGSLVFAEPTTGKRGEYPLSKGSHEGDLAVSQG